MIRFYFRDIDDIDDFTNILWTSEYRPEVSTNILTIIKEVGYITNREDRLSRYKVEDISFMPLQHDGDMDCVNVLLKEV